MRDYLRPWKLTTLAIGLSLLLIGADYYNAPDWDYPVSFIMAVSTYLTAPYATRVILDRNWSEFPLAMLFAWLSIDGLYAAYWSTVSPAALVMREANAYASTALYFICGVIWLYKGSLKELAGSFKDAWRRSR